MIGLIGRVDNWSNRCVALRGGLPLLILYNRNCHTIVTSRY